MQAIGGPCFGLLGKGQIGSSVDLKSHTATSRVIQFTPQTNAARAEWDTDVTGDEGYQYSSEEDEDRYESSFSNEEVLSVLTTDDEDIPLSQPSSDRRRKRKRAFIASSSSDEDFDSPPWRKKSIGKKKKTVVLGDETCSNTNYILGMHT